MPQYVWLIVYLAGGACIAVEGAVRILQTVARLRPANQEDDASKRLLQVAVLAKGADPKDKTPDGLLLNKINAIANPTQDGITATGTPFFSFLNTVATKNVFLAAGVALLLIPTLVGQGVSIDFNGTTPAPTATSSP